jgi:hypothetical protein
MPQPVSFFNILFFLALFGLVWSIIAAAPLCVSAHATRPHVLKWDTFLRQRPKLVASAQHKHHSSVTVTRVSCLPPLTATVTPLSRPFAEWGCGLLLLADKIL